MKIFKLNLTITESIITERALRSFIENADTHSYDVIVAKDIVRKVEEAIAYAEEQREMEDDTRRA